MEVIDMGQVIQNELWLIVDEKKLPLWRRK